MGENKQFSSRFKTEFFGYGVKITALVKVGANDGEVTMATVTFEVLDVRESNIRLFSTSIAVIPYLVYETKVVPPEFPSLAVVSIVPSSVLSPAVGEQLVFNINVAVDRRKFNATRKMIILR